ncbi:MAG: hypothetical protein KJO55_06680, partial [Gammaproteobacteria bacterium]|nr:hypothetical protein [Gammaproteobacteria bacterium]
MSWPHAAGQAWSNELMLRLLWKWAAATFSVVVILLAIAIGLFRLIVPMIPQHHERIEAFASDAAGTPVRIGEISARWRWRGPELRFTDARLLTADGSETLLSADEGSIIIDLGALLRGEVRAGQVQLDGLQLQLTRDADNRWLIGGRLLDGRNEQKLPRLSLGLREAQVIFRDEINDAGPWVFDDVELDVELRAKTLAIDSVMQLPAGLGRRAELSLQADGELKNFAELDWQLYSRVDDIELFGWRALMPAGRVVPGAGRGDVVLWFGARGNRIQQISLQTDLSDLEFNRDDTPLRELEQLSGRFEFDRLAGGWQANGRDVQVSSAGSEWPVTSFSVEQVEDDSGSRLFYADLNYLRLEDFAPLLDWVPDEEWRQRLTTLAPRGVVEDLSIRSREAKDETASFSLRGQFDKLGFNPVESLPGITNLAGEM